MDCIDDENLRSEINARELFDEMSAAEVMQFDKRSRDSKLEIGLSIDGDADCDMPGEIDAVVDGSKMEKCFLILWKSVQRLEWCIQQEKVRQWIRNAVQSLFSYICPKSAMFSVSISDGAANTTFGGKQATVEALSALHYSAGATNEQTKIEEVEPNSGSFLAVLTACSHSRLVNEARKHFEKMIQACAISAALEHYSAISNLPGQILVTKQIRALDQLKEFEDLKPLKPA